MNCEPTGFDDVSLFVPAASTGIDVSERAAGLGFRVTDVVPRLDPGALAALPLSVTSPAVAFDVTSSVVSVLCADIPTDAVLRSWEKVAAAVVSPVVASASVVAAAALIAADSSSEALVEMLGAVLGACPPTALAVLADPVAGWSVLDPYGWSALATPAWSSPRLQELCSVLASEVVVTAGGRLWSVRHRGSARLMLKRVPDTFLSAAQLCLPSALLEPDRVRPGGLTVVCGRTCSGVSSTVAAVAAAHVDSGTAWFVGAPGHVSAALTWSVMDVDGLDEALAEEVPPVLVVDLGGVPDARVWSLALDAADGGAAVLMGARGAGVGAVIDSAHGHGVDRGRLDRVLATVAAQQLVPCADGSDVVVAADIVDCSASAGASSGAALVSAADAGGRRIPMELSLATLLHGGRIDYATAAHFSPRLARMRLCAQSLGVSLPPLA